VASERHERHGAVCSEACLPGPGHQLGLRERDIEPDRVQVALSQCLGELDADPRVVRQERPHGHGGSDSGRQPKADEVVSLPRAQLADGLAAQALEHSGARAAEDDLVQANCFCQVGTERFQRGRIGDLQGPRPADELATQPLGYESEPLVEPAALVGRVEVGRRWRSDEGLLHQRPADTPPAHAGVHQHHRDDRDRPEVEAEGRPCEG